MKFKYTLSKDVLEFVKDAKLKEGRLADLTPTMLDIMGIKKPEEMTGESLIEKE